MTREYVRLTKLHDTNNPRLKGYEIEGWLLKEEKVGEPLRIRAELINKQRVDRVVITKPLTKFYFINMGIFFVKVEGSQYQLEYINRNSLLGDNNESQRVSSTRNEDKSPS